ncbi:coiled-coil domain-containing protein 17 isoform X2 [Solea solea]|uniref:coiled-coil domain-containing protein 17 isoform X2 n=1 Tax=Solea solea TaxID=90069 RepID=UPI00272988A9|nr:coiled-coil domain-containing protein 17 isoform X2 [Solea solea]
MEKDLICGACNMVFRSAGLFEKHKALFCISTEVSGGGADTTQRRTPDLVTMRDRQRNATRWRSADAEQKSGRAENKPQTSQTDSAALQNLTDEEHDRQLRRHHMGHSDRLKEMREMATLHECQVALIQAHNQELQRQRDELARQVNVLGEQRNTSHLESVLMELRAQEERNEETLQQFAEHLHALHAQKVSSLPADHQDNYKLVPSADGPLSAQIKALRQAYVHSGGSDPGIIAQMVDLQTEAQSVERNQATASAEARRKKEKPPQRGTSWELLLLEQENQRLEEEILRIQWARERNQNYEALRTELELIQRETLQQVDGVGRSRGAPRPCRQPPPPAPPRPPPPLQANTHIPTALSLFHARSSSSPSGRHILDPVDSLGPAPYDPAAGFVIFFDLVLGVTASQKALCLVAALYSEGVEVGPQSLPPVKCLPGVSSPYSHSLIPGNYALLSVKQPVPRVQPSSSLCLVVEVQAAHDQDVQPTSSGWTCVELFDQYNQLHSGHWRVPVRCLPVQPSLNIAQLNTIPQVGNMELCMRLVNGRDEDVQTLMEPDPSRTRHYKYPAVVSPFNATVHGSLAQLVSAPQG